MDPDGHARRVLEFDKLLEMVALRARSAGGSARWRARVPTVEVTWVKAQQALLQELRSAIEAGVGHWPLDSIHDLRPFLQTAQLPGSRLESSILRSIADTLENVGRMRRFLDSHSERLPLIRELATRLRAHDSLVSTIHKAILETGAIADEASPQLRQIRQQLSRQRNDLLRRLEKKLADATASDHYVTLRGDRYVIPVRADAAGSVRGIVHDRSASGATLFVEPLEVVDANNELQALSSREAREIQRILEELTAGVASASADALISLEVLEEIDMLHAAAELAIEMQAGTPRLGETLRLRAARHPLLARQLQEHGERIVPLDVDLGDAHGLVVTGPNTGGKTVALKCIGLLVFMHQSGLQIPAHPDSEMPIYARILADIGDEQSIESAESTFSSHLRHVTHAVRAAAPRVLTLLDEFMSGTDPDEGAALAKAVLRRLVARGATAIVTTHLGALKLFAHSEAGLANASMQFDPQSRTPLYRLQPGVPGSSNALLIAERLGLDADLLEAARSERGEEAHRLEDAIQALTQEQQRLQRASQEAHEASAEAHRLREEHAQKMAQVTAKRQELLDEARRQAHDLLSGTQARIEQVVRELRETKASRESIREAHDTLQELREKLAPAEMESSASEQAAPFPGKPEIGDTVWLKSLGREGVLKSLAADGRARVQLGNVELMVHARDLIRRGSKSETPAPGPPASTRTPGGYDVESTQEAALRLDVRGLDREQALAAVDRFLDRALLQGVPVAQIVHGKGTGVLRQSIQEYLAEHPNVAGHRLGEHGEGGSGVTIVQLQ